MPKTKISEFSATPGNNTDIDGINIAEGCAPSGINDAIRELMAQLKDFQAGTAGDSFNGPVGTTTAAAGAFTTLSASSTVSGAGFSTYLASPPAIGGTAAAAGSFTTLSASSTVTLSGGTANGVAYLNGSKVVTTGSALTFDGTTFKAAKAGTSFIVSENTATASAALIQVKNTAGSTYLGQDSTGGYLLTDYAAPILFYINSSEQMRLTSTGLGIGTSSPSYKLDALSSGNTQVARFRTGGTGTTDIVSFERTDSAVKAVINYNGTDGTMTYGTTTNHPIAFATNSTEQMRLTSTGLGIGTSSPAAKLQVATASASPSSVSAGVRIYDTTNNYGLSLGSNGSYGWIQGLRGATSTDGYNDLVLQPNSGNLGLGVTPSAWSGATALQVSGTAALYANNTVTGLSFNQFFNGTNNIYLRSDYANRLQMDSGAFKFFTAPSGTAGNAITFTQAMTLDASGNLGVGATSPTDTNNFGRALDIRSSTGAAAYFRDSDDATKYSVAGFFGADNNAYYGAWGTSTGVLFYSSGSERARITSGGYFKASDSGTYDSSAGAYHEFYQTADQTALYIRATNASLSTGALVGIAADRNTTNNSFYALSYYNNGAAAYKFRVADSGNVTNTNGSYGTISDAKMKTDIVDAGSQWADIKGLRFRKFKMKDDPQQVVQLGVVAQEVAQVSPGLVEEHVDRDAEGNDLGTTTKSVKTSVLLMKAAVALQEAMARIEQLEAKVASLEAK